MAQNYPPSAIAVVGMGCKFPGADSIEEYWDILDAGRSMVTEVPTDRFPTRNHRRSTEKSIFFGNFIQDVASFDNRFFKKSSREASSMDPQQRLLLEVAYQALESSGYFGPGERDHDIGCFVGSCTGDYVDNVASHPPNAYSSLGTLRAFLTGKISHYFGFSGPSITYDTACSSSAVAIDAACKAILCGDCTSAIAGGASIFTSPHFYQNLAAASFLSPTGANKSFDKGADGYCRGEGVGLVVLKKLSQALDDGDTIFGTILSTSVKQSSNQVPITVPHSPSQTALYRRALHTAGVAAEEVTYLEAHGTGTPIGDPREYEGIKETFCSQQRKSPLYFASVKGNIGHTEGASGVAGLIKTVLMMQKQAIPRQASFTEPNPSVSLIPGQLIIPTETVPWSVDTRIACVNNYGAAGSIAVMVVREPPPMAGENEQSPKSLSKYPVIVTANSPKSLAENCRKLREHIASFSSRADALADLAFNLSSKQDRCLPNMLATTVSSMSELDDQFRTATSQPESLPCRSNPSPKPVVLMFGGQTDRSVSISRSVYETSGLIRKHLDACQDVLQDLGHDGLYPGIFDTTPIDDVVSLQTMQFALQYACAQSWIESGLQVDCLLGHSFGQLVALTVSGILSLADGLKLVHGRAVLMRDQWGSDTGSMIALEADYERVQGLIAAIQKRDATTQLEVACYNGPRSHVLVGSESEIDLVIQAAKETPAVKYKVLNVTHGFHSRFCDAIHRDLETLADSLTYREPKIRLETCSERESWPLPTAQLISDHTRSPVYFGEAVKRINERYGPCTWLEAGSDTSITSMARRALLDPDTAAHLFCPVHLGRNDALDMLTDTTAELWNHGHHVQFWPFHRLYHAGYRSLHLPPYQFEKAKHWLEFKETSPAIAVPDEPRPDVYEEPVLIRFDGIQDSPQQAVFTIDPRAAEWRSLVDGHAILQQPLCPAPLYVELVLRAARELARAKNIPLPHLPTVEGLEIPSALGVSHDKTVRLTLTQSAPSSHQWDFIFQSYPKLGAASPESSAHAVGSIHMAPSDELARLGRVLKHHRLAEMASDGEAIQGSLVYRVFSRVVQYHDFYQGVRKVQGNAGSVAAQVHMPPQPDVLRNGLLSHPVVVDNFLQVPGLYANCLASCPPQDVFVCTHIDRMQLAADFAGSDCGRWDVFATCTAVSDKESSNDIFAMEQATGKLVFVAFGARFSRVRIAALAKALSRANESADASLRPVERVERPSPQPVTTETASSESQNATRGPGVEEELRSMLARMTDVPAEQFHGTVRLDELGIDSLMATEIVSEVHEVFHISILQDHLQELQTFDALRDYLDQRGARGTPPKPQGTSSKPQGTRPPALPRSTSTAAAGPGKKDDTASRLASLLGSHLECPADSFERSTNLAARGLDSLLVMELMSDIEKLFCASVDLAQLTTESSFGDLVDLVSRTVTPGFTSSSISSEPVSTPGLATPTVDVNDWTEEPSGKTSALASAVDCFESVKQEFDKLAGQYKFAGFYEKVYDRNTSLILAYTVEAYADLGHSLDLLHTGDKIPALDILPKHHNMHGVLHEILHEGGVADYDGKGYVRSAKPISSTHSSVLFQEMLRDFPQHAKENELLNLCGADLAKLLSGEKDPLAVLFGSKASRDILESVYTDGPVYVVLSQMLTDFLDKALSCSSPGPGGKFRILEIGAGTGSTTKWVVKRLVQRGIPVEYTFTDISSSLVSAAKRKFSQYDCIQYTTLNIENEPPAQYHGQFDVVLSTNCIHATRNLSNSLTNIHKLLRPNGFVSLVEFTTRMYWFDVIFGLLEGWWLFNDGRSYALVPPEHWDERMRASGFQHVSWTGGSTRESEVCRVITGFRQPVSDPSLYRSISQEKSERPAETVVFKHTDAGLPLYADIYPPSTSQAAAHETWTVGTSTPALTPTLMQGTR